MTKRNSACSNGVAAALRERDYVLMVRLLAVWLPISQVLGCHEDIQPDPGAQTGPGTGQEPDAATPDRLDAALPRACPAESPGPRMVAVPAAGFPEAYCMDTTEVTQAQYFEFLKAKGASLDGHVIGDVSGQREECAKNNPWLAPIYFDENPTSCAIFPIAFDRTEGHPDYPVGCVDWCDAAAYCAWAGKRLCGAVGGGPVQVDDKGEIKDVATSEFYQACSQGGKTAYSYGDNYESGACAYNESPGDLQTQPAGAKAGCRGATSPYDEVHDLSGNLAEWQEGCWTVPGAPGFACAGATALVGIAPTAQSTTRCDQLPLLGAAGLSPTIGFRCCAELL